MTPYDSLYQTWLAHTTGALHDELLAIAGDDAAIADRFYQTLAFGTAGLRGVMGTGTNRMNCYTVGLAARGLADTLENRTVAIGYDCRHHSEEYARHTASVLAAAGVEVWIYRELMPTPMLSYAVRQLRCGAGVMITASHNSAEYNGFKCYGPDGCQMTDESADAVLQAMQRLDLFAVPAEDFDAALLAGKIHFIDDALIESYYQAVMTQSVQPELVPQSGLKVLYTPLCGTGNKPVREILRRLGVPTVAVVRSQELPDGSFATCPSPNPETPSAWNEALAQAPELNPDIILATDPDADRMGVTVPDGQGGYVTLTGNEIGCLMLDYLLRSRRIKGTLPARAVAVKSIVSTPMAKAIADAYGCEMRDVLTGFKYIGETILHLEQAGEAERFVFGFEESSGFLAGTHARDKDAVVAAMLLCELAADARTRGLTLLEEREALYARFGFYVAQVDSQVFPGQAGAVEMQAFMEQLRQNPPAELAGMAVTERLDYRERTHTFADGRVEPLTLPRSNVLCFRMGDKVQLIARPSGTEPKLKLYYSAAADTRKAAHDMVAALREEMSRRLK